MNMDTVQELIELGNGLASMVGLPAGSPEVIGALEEMAVAVGKAYEGEAGKPIDPSLFVPEAPLEG